MAVVRLRSAELEVDVLPYGASVRAIRVRLPGGWRNVALSPRDPRLLGPACGYLGATVGRVAGRIRGACFDLDGVRHVLTANERGHTLHGGAVGFDSRPWRVVEVTPDHVRLDLVSPAGDQGFPGRVEAGVTYAVSGPTLSVTYLATTDAPTPVSLTSHTYVNLAGEGSGDVLGHELQVAASAYAPTDDEGLPLGHLAPVEGTPFDHRTPRRVAADLDATFALDGAGPRFSAKMREVAWLRDPASGLTLTLASDAPSLQVYSGSQLDGSVIGTGGTAYAAGAGIALETQGFPDAVHHDAFPSVIVRPGETYASHTTWRFTHP